MSTRWLRSFQNLQRLPEVFRAMTRLEDWWSVLRAYLQFGETSYPVKFATRSGTQLQLDSFDELVTAWVVFCRDEYSIPADARVVLDIGANYGAFSLLAAQMAPASVIYSLEPFPETFAKLQANIEVNGLSERVTPLQMAVSPQTGSAPMNSDPDIGSHLRTLDSVSPEVTPSNNWVDVPTISLSELIEEVVRKEGVEFIDIVKMDIEGGEYEIFSYFLDNPGKFTFRCGVIELHLPENADANTAILDRFLAFLASQTIETSFYHYPSKLFHFRDFAEIRKESKASNIMMGFARPACKV